MEISFFALNSCCVGRFIIECFNSRGPHLCKFFGTKESVGIRKEFNSHRIGLGHQHGGHFIVLRHQYGRRDVMWKHSRLRPQAKDSENCQTPTGYFRLQGKPRSLMFQNVSFVWSRQISNNDKKLIVTMTEMSKKNKQFFKWCRKEGTLNKLKIFSSLSC